MHITTNKMFGGSQLAPFSAFFKDVDTEADAIIQEGAEDIARLAENEVVMNAFRTGRLAGGFIVQRIRSLSYRVSNVVHYADIVHNGWGNQPYARPFFDWAIDNHGDTTTNRLAALLAGRRGDRGGRKAQSWDDAMDQAFGGGS